MTKLDKRNAVAEIDGLVYDEHSPYASIKWRRGAVYSDLPNYPEDYNAIIRVIQKQPPAQLALIAEYLFNAAKQQWHEYDKDIDWSNPIMVVMAAVQLTSEQLCDALLAAHGK